VEKKEAFEIVDATQKFDDTHLVFRALEFGYRANQSPPLMGLGDFGRDDVSR